MNRSVLFRLLGVGAGCAVAILLLPPWTAVDAEPPERPRAIPTRDPFEPAAKSHGPSQARATIAELLEQQQRANIEQAQGWSGETLLDQLAAHRANEASVLLEAEEFDHVRTVYAQFLEVKARFEMPLVKVASFDGQKLCLSIPAYPEAGRHLQHLMKEELGRVIPPEKLSRLWKSLQPGLTQDFMGFGTYEQTYEVTRGLSSERLPAYKLVRVAEKIRPDDSGIRDINRSTAVLTANELRGGVHASIEPTLSRLMPLRLADSDKKA